MKTATAEPIEKTLSWFPCLADWTRHPLCRRLRKADKANPDRWMHLVSEAHRCKNDGRLQMADGTILAVEDLAYDHDREDEEWEAFLELCEQLGLVTRDSDGCMAVAKWSSWNRKAAHDREAAKQKKRAQRAVAKAEALEAKIVAERVAHETQIAEVRAYLSSPMSPSVPDLEGVTQKPVPAVSRQCPGSVPAVSPDVPDLDKTRLDLDKDKSKSNSARVRGRKATIPPLSPRPAIGDRSQRDSDEIKFSQIAETCYIALMSKPFDGRDAERFYSALLAEPWRSAPLEQRALAVEQACRAVSDEVAGGDQEPQESLWLAALDRMSALLSKPQAADTG